jgi:Bacterial protein of unknown function (DUF839)
MSNRKKIKTGAAIVGATVFLGAGISGAAPAGTSIGPRTTKDPYVIPINPAAVQIKSLLSTLDLPAGGASAYKMAGIPDGLGMYSDQGTIKFVASHELPAASGVVRTHGSKGSFIANYSLDGTTYDVTDGKDLWPSAAAIDYSGTNTAGGGNDAFSRFCSSDLSTASSFYNASTGNGYNGLLFFSGEEDSSSPGRMVATDPLTGNAKVLTALGRLSWENALAANTSASDTTVIMGNHDSGPGYNNIYVGTKTSTGSNFDRAGLTNGTTYGYKVTTAGVIDDATFRSTVGKGTAVPFTLTAALSPTAQTVTAYQTDLMAKGAIKLDRTEDGAWDPQNPNDYYFLTTGSIAATATGGRGGLWKMSFVDRTNPAAGGTLTLLLDGNEATTNPLTPDGPLYMPDNMTIDAHGHLVIQEDPGNDNYLARMWAYDIATGGLKAIATFDPAIFGSAGPTKAAPGSNAGTPTNATSFLTRDEESSGVIATEALLGADTFLFDAQIHTTALPATYEVENGQFLTMKVDFAALFGGLPTNVPEFQYPAIMAMAAGLGVGGFLLIRRRQLNTATS